MQPAGVIDTRRADSPHPFSRPDGRAVDEVRAVSFAPGIAPHAHGSVLARFGDTAVICAAMIEDKVPPWMTQQRVPGGWLSAEYSLLPYSTLDRKQRDIARGKLDGRTVEIQRLIGRALRAVVDLSKLPGMTLWVDCDVLQADGGTRTAAISGAYVAARLAEQKLLAAGKIKGSFFTDSVAAVSAGIWRGHAVLDLNYLEDKDAEVDANIVLTGAGRFVEIQSSGEEATFSGEELDALVALARKGAAEITLAQAQALKGVQGLKASA
jgi:ribonuclease PH